MSAPNRTSLLNKLHKVLKKHYKPVASPERLVLEHLLYACCVENARFEAGDEAFAKIQETYFDWNEVRVTTVTELAEVMAGLPDAVAAASRLKRCLQAVFESHYSFDLEFLKKQNLGKAVKELENYNGATPFVIAYTTQHALGGHAVPVNQGALDALVVLGAISEADAKQQRVPGLERAIPKSKGVEFGSLLHQLGADYFASPFSTRVRSLLTEIEPSAKQRLPKRRVKGEEGAAEEGAEAAAGSGGDAGKGAARKTPKKPSGKKPAASASAKKKSSGAHAKKSSTKKLTKKKPR